MFEEIRLASFIAKATTGSPTVLPARTALAMGTRLGAQALHLGHLTGSIETGKRADLVLVELDKLHNLPGFNRDPDSIYSRLVYAAKSTDVTDVMVNGQWLMRNQELLTIEEKPLLKPASTYAEKIDAFLIEREESVLSKLIAIGDAEQEQSYEVQIKVRLPDPSIVLDKLASGAFEIVRKAHYMEFDTYFEFEDPSQGRLRHREDEFVDEKGEVFNVRYRLTLTGPAAVRAYPNSVLLSRSRFIAPATHSLRFYREYFKPTKEVEIVKDRLRWLVRFQGVEIFINVDQVLKPPMEGCFLEFKSRTWSRRDAERKAELISQMLQEMGLESAEPVSQEYPDLVSG
jgi:5-methylthioadenosine/S-adenosylhomocysteine deaminase